MVVGLTAPCYVHDTPTQNEVVLKVATSDPSEGTISTVAALPGQPTQLLHFDARNWLDAQMVYVRGQADGEADGDVLFDITVSIFDATNPIQSDLALDAVATSFVNEDSEQSVAIVVNLDRNFTSADGGSIHGTVTLLATPEVRREPGCDRRLHDAHTNSFDTPSRCFRAV
jgi:hypothetical protein